MSRLRSHCLSRLRSTICDLFFLIAPPQKKRPLCLLPFIVQSLRAFRWELDEEDEHEEEDENEEEEEDEQEGEDEEEEENEEEHGEEEVRYAEEENMRKR